MSSLGGQWRVLRGYLASSGLGAEVERLVLKLRPVTADQWDNLLKKFEQVIAMRLTNQDAKQIQVSKDSSTRADSVQHSTTVQRAAATAPVPAPAPAPTLNERQDKEKRGLSVGSEAKDITIDGLLQGLKLKKDLHFGKISEPGWKDNKPLVTKSSIHSRTSYVISAMVSASSGACLVKRTEDFIHHINQYPEARDLAIKEGAVRALLRAQERLRAGHAQGEARGEGEGEGDGVINEALALVGYCAPTRGPGPNILSIDGGGIRGLIAIEVLRHLERLTQRPVNELFDYVIGVSTGAIIAAVIGGGVGNLDTASRLYHTLSKEMFGNTSVIEGTSRLVWSHSYYDTEKWEKMLRDHLGDTMLSHCNRKRNPKMALVSCVVSGGGSRLVPFLFRSYSCGYRVRGAVRGTAAARVWHAARASAAAPTYFAEFHHAGLVHQDGGLMVNNPAGLGLHEARLLWGADALAKGTLVSLGTGQPLPALGPPLSKHDKQRETEHTKGTSWKDKFNTILDSATDTQGVHLMLNDLLPSGAYYRFNPPLMEPCAMDETDPGKISDMMTDTHAYIRRNQHKFEEAARRLTRRRSLLQRAGDQLRHRALLTGLAPAH